MSYYTHVEITVVDGNLALDPHDVQVARVKPYIEKFRAMEHRGGFDAMYLDQIDAILAGKLLLMHGYSSQAQEFVRYLSECFPDTTFAARGIGEEFDDIWRFQCLNREQIVNGAAAEPTPALKSPGERQIFTRVPNTTVQGWRSLVRPAYLKLFLAALALFVAAIIILS